MRTIAVLFLHLLQPFILLPVHLRRLIHVLPLLLTLCLSDTLPLSCTASSSTVLIYSSDVLSGKATMLGLGA